MKKVLRNKYVVGILVLMVVCLGIVFADDVVVQEGDIVEVRNVTATGTGRFDGGIGVGTDPSFALHINTGEVNITGTDAAQGTSEDACDVLVVTGGAGFGGPAGRRGSDILLTSGAGGGGGTGQSGGDIKLTSGIGGGTGGKGGNIELTPGEGGPLTGVDGNVILSKNGGKVLIGMDIADANVAILQVDGTAVADGWVDWTPVWAGTKEQALQSILDITNKDDGKGGVEIDHKTLPDLAYVDLSYYTDVNCTTVTEDIVVDGITYENVTHEVCDKKLVVKEGRSLGGMITVMVEAIKALEAENQMLKDQLCLKDPGYSWCE